MESLTFSFEAGQNGKYVTLLPIPDHELSEAMWQKLADNIAKEEGLSHYQATVLSGRWEQGRAAIAIKDNEIVSYISLIPIFDGAARQKLSQAAAIPLASMPAIEMYESATGWTHPAWRHRGQSLQLRRQLLDRFAKADRLFISATIGLGASYVLPKLGWQLAAWSGMPFATSLMGMPVAGLEDKIRIRQRQPPELKAYEGEPTSPQQNKSHQWAKFCHFWLSDMSLAIALDEQLANLMNGDLPRWRETVVTVLYASPPEPTWKPFLFS